MRSPTARILGAQKAVKVFRELTAHSIEICRDDAERDPTTKIHEALDRCSRRLLGR